MSSTLYRCRATAWLKPQNWEYAIKFDEREIKKIELSIKIPNPGQAVGFKVGTPLYENNSVATVTVKDKFLLKAGWIGLEAAQRIQDVPEIPIPPESRTAVKDLLSDITAAGSGAGSEPDDVTTYLTKAVFATLIIEFSYGFGSQEKFLTQKYFYKIKSMKGGIGNDSSSYVTFTGEGLYRSILSQTRENYAIAKNTPIAEVVREHHNHAMLQATGVETKNEPKIRVDSTVDNTAINADLRTNGSTPAAALAKVEASNNVRIVEDPREPLKYSVVTDAPSTRTVFFMGRGLFEGMTISGENTISGANAFRNNADRYATSTGSNSDTYTETETVVGDVAVPAGTGAYIENVTESDSIIKYKHPEVGDLEIDLTNWMEERAGSPSNRELNEEATIVTRKTSHAAFDNIKSKPQSDVFSLWGGKVTAREDNETPGNGVIVIKSNAYINYKDKEYQITEHYAHCLDHAELSATLKPGDKVGTVNNKSESQTISEEHLHGAFSIDYNGSRVYVHPTLALKSAYLRKEAKEKEKLTTGSGNPEAATPETPGTPDTSGTKKLPTSNATYPENEAMLRIVLAESRTTGLLGMALVARVILNRACTIKNVGANFLSKGSTKIYDIIVANNQFEPTFARNKTNNWKDAFTLATSAQVKVAKQAISLAQKPEELKAKLIADGVNNSTATALVLSTFFAARAGIINPSVKQAIRFQQKGRFDDHYFGIAKVFSANAQQTLCSKTSINVADIDVSQLSSDAPTGSTTQGQSGSANPAANAIGSQGFVGIPEVDLSFIGVPRALFIQPGFTYLVFDTRDFVNWARAKGNGSDFMMPVPKDYKDWNIVAVSYTWEGDLRVTIKGIRPLSGDNPAFSYKGEDFKDISTWKGNYKQYLRSFTDLCYKITEGDFAGKSSCEVATDLNTQFVKSRTNTPSSVSSSSTSASDPKLAGKRVYPQSGKVTSIFGAVEGIRSGRGHSGVDISSGGNAEIFAAMDGKVVRADDTAGGEFGGKGVILDHAGGYRTQYFHMSEVKAKAGATVKAGDVLGIEGRTGTATGKHVHFDLRKSGSKLNPATLFPKLSTKGNTIVGREVVE